MLCADHRRRNNPETRTNAFQRSNDCIRCVKGLRRLMRANPELRRDWFLFVSAMAFKLGDTKRYLYWLERSKAGVGEEVLLLGHNAFAKVLAPPSGFEFTSYAMKLRQMAERGQVVDV